jgi:hypothetical protein
MPRRVLAVPVDFLSFQSLTAQGDFTIEPALITKVEAELRYRSATMYYLRLS